jgi:hypothetical protein
MMAAFYVSFASALSDSVDAPLNVTPCLRKFLLALTRSHSNPGGSLSSNSGKADVSPNGYRFGRRRKWILARGK